MILIRVRFGIPSMSLSIVVDIVGQGRSCICRDEAVAAAAGVIFMWNYVTLVIVLKYGSYRMAIEVKNVLHNL